MLENGKVLKSMISLVKKLEKEQIKAKKSTRKKIIDNINQKNIKCLSNGGKQFKSWFLEQVIKLIDKKNEEKTLITNIRN